MLWIITRSLILDISFFLLPLTLSEKIEFITKKYIILFKNYVFSFIPGTSFVSLYGKKYYYDDKYGIAFLQSVYVDNFLLQKIIPEKGIIVDIGANIGQFNFFCQSVLQAKKVYSFEPLPEQYKLLKLNARNNTFQYAITTKKKLTLYFSDTSLTASEFAKESGAISFSVICKKADDIPILKKEKEITLFKIDTEGSEFDVVKASKQLLKKSRYILIETSLSRKSSGNAVKLISLLHEILPKIELLTVGRSFYDASKSVMATDMIFINKGI